MTTCFFSVFAYLWVIVVLSISSPNRVTIVEGVITLALFPILVGLSYAADRGKFRRCKFLGNSSRREHSVIIRDQDWMDTESTKIKAVYGQELPATVLHAMLRQKDERRAPSKAQRRNEVMQNVTGGTMRRNMGSDELSFSFEQTQYVVLENGGTLLLKVLASRVPNVQVQIRYSTRDGSAKAGSRYQATEGILKFSPSQTEATIEIPIIDDDVWQADEHFTCELSNLSVQSPGRPAMYQDAVPKLRVSVTKITVQNDDMPGTLGFDDAEVYGMEGETVLVGVNRTNGNAGFISCRYKTGGGTAVERKDYTPVQGTLQFKDKETHQVIKIPILKNLDYATEKEERLRVMLFEPSAGVQFENASHGIRSDPVCEVVIPASKSPLFMTRLKRSLNQDQMGRAWDLYVDQLAGAIYVNGSAEDQSQCGPTDWFFHVASLTFKIFFAIIPPAPLGGGWPCFCGALGMVGLVTAVVGDMATLLGCCLGIPDDITAISLVALGTSLPDTFASKLAAQQDDCADNSIGNVTGSNSVNVFLGLGLPWTLAAIYWSGQGATDVWKAQMYNGKSYEELFLPTYPNGGFMVPKGSLEISVVVFSLCAVCCLALLAFRRYTYGGELGGPKGAQTRDSCILVILWLIYIAVSCAVSVTQ